MHPKAGTTHSGSGTSTARYGQGSISWNPTPAPSALQMWKCRDGAMVLYSQHIRSGELAGPALPEWVAVPDVSQLPALPPVRLPPLSAFAQSPARALPRQLSADLAHLLPPPELQCLGACSTPQTGSSTSLRSADGQCALCPNWLGARQQPPTCIALAGHAECGQVSEKSLLPASSHVASGCNLPLSVTAAM